MLALRADRQSPLAVVDEIVAELDVLKKAEPGIRIEPLPRHFMDVIVVDDAMGAHFLDVDSFFRAVVHVVVGDFEMLRPRYAQRLVRRLVNERLARAAQLLIIGADDLTAKHANEACVPDADA